MAALCYLVLAALVCVAVSEVLVEAKNKYEIVDKGMTLDVQVDHKPKPRPHERRCCFPKRFEGRIREIVGASVNGTGTGYGIEGFFVHDFAGKKFAVKDEVWVGHKVVGKYRVIADFNKLKMYIVNEEKKSCKSIPLPKKKVKKDAECLPRNATFIGSQILGGSLKTDVYHYGMKTKTAEVFSMITVADKRGFFFHKRSSCLPVHETVSGGTFKGGKRSGFMASVEFFDIKEKITDRKIFQLPKKCQRVSPQIMEELGPMMKMMQQKYMSDE
jgi:hypothetical protein